MHYYIKKTAIFYSLTFFLLSSCSGILPRVDLSSYKNFTIDTNTDTGVAPLSVFFGIKEITPDTSEDRENFYNPAFENYSILWDFDDVNSGVFTSTAQSRNSSYGPLAVHIFDNPGVYHVTVKAIQPDGTTINSEKIITVTNPDIVFSGDNTICFDPDGDFSESPPGSINIVTNSFDAAFPYIQKGKRILFHRGKTFTSSSQFSLDSEGPGHIGAYGSGEKPLIISSNTGYLFYFTSMNNATKDWRIADLQFQKTTGRVFDSGLNIKELLLYRLDFNNQQGELFFSTDTTDYFKTPPHEMITIAECTFNHFNNSFELYCGGNYISLIGNTISDDNNAAEIVFTYLNKGLIQHNIINSSGANNGTLAIFANTSIKTTQFSNDQRISSHIIISDNVITSNARNIITLSPGDNISYEIIQNCLIENNHIVSRSYTNNLISINGKNITVRNNIGDYSLSTIKTAITISNNGIVLNSPSNIQIYHNTFSCTSVNDENSIVTGVIFYNQFGIESGNNVVFNNVFYFPNSISYQSVDDDGQNNSSFTNFAGKSQIFSLMAPVTAKDYTPVSASEIIDKGTNDKQYIYDYFRKQRIFDGDSDDRPQSDPGAIEYYQ